MVAKPVDEATAITLALDASTYSGTVAVIRGRSLAATTEAAMRGEDEERLMPAVLATLQEAGCDVRDVARVVCGAGPGSFTSLRIAGAIAKGIALGNDVPLYAVPSLLLIVAGADDLAAGRWLALLDAMRGERYASLVERGADRSVREVEALGRIAAANVASEAARLSARAIGPQEETKCSPHARGVARMLDAVLESGRVSIDDWEPAYGRLAEAQVKWESAHGRELPR